MDVSSAPLVLVTGCTGYLGSVLVAYALAAGYCVRGTARDPTDARKCGPIRELRGPRGTVVEIVRAELDSAAGWAEAMQGVTYVLHSASPVPTDHPKDPEAEVIRPAVNGALNVLRAAAASASVRRVVQTSSVAAVNEGRTGEWASRPFTEADWSDVGKAGVYPVSKTRAEQAAWAFMASDEARARPAGAPPLELVTVNPGLILGPPATRCPGSSTIVYSRLFTRSMPAIPALCMPAVDVRDVAVAHLRAMLLPGAAGRRHILVARTYTLAAIAADLAAAFDPLGYRIPTTRLPSWVVRLAAWFDGALSIVAPMLDKTPAFDTRRAEAPAAEGGLGMRWRDVRESCLQGAYALIAKGVLEDKTHDKRLSTGAPAAAAVGGGGGSAPADSLALTPAAWHAYAVGSVIAPGDLEGVTWVALVDDAAAPAS